MPHSPVRLYIGFGGSGAKTLAEFVDVLAQHGEWGDEAETRCAFILADTDANDLRKLEARIRETKRRIGQDPIVRAIRTSEGVSVFQHYVADQLERNGHHERVKEHWWYNGNVPFTAERLTGSPEDGAGQCPMVSTFLAWNQLDRIGQEIKDVVDQLTRRMTLGPGNQNWTLHTTIIAGLAGGTGRGCWHLIGMKVREVLAGIGRHTMPVGYFYDSSVFSDIMARSPGQANKMRVNALTGFSELAGWMRNETHRPQPYNFQLPSIGRPGDRAADLIDVGRVVRGAGGKELPGVPGQSPVNQAFVVFGGGRAGRPGSPESYYKSVANAIYARLVREVASGAVNGAAFGGVGAASIEVPINEIRGYVRGYVSKFLPAELAHQMKTDVVDAWVGHLTDGLTTPRPFTYSPKADGALLERILSAVMAGVQPRLHRLRECMEPKTKDYKRAEEECKRLDGWASSKDGAAAIGTIAEQVLAALFWGSQAGPDAVGTGGVLRDLGALDRLTEEEYYAIFGGSDKVRRKNPVAEALRRVVMRKQVKLSNPDGTTEVLDLAGFGTKAELAKRVAKALAEIAEELPGAPAGTDPGAAGAPAMPLFTKARQGLLRSGIDDNERGMILNAAGNRVRTMCMGPVKKVVEHSLNRAADELKDLARELESIVKTLTDKSEEQEEALSASREQLFWTAEDFRQAVSNSADATFGAGMLAEHRLQPVANDEDLEKALRAQMTGGANEQFDTHFAEFVEHIDSWIRAASADSDSAERGRALRRMVEKHIPDLSQKLVLPRSFYVDQFGFFATVRGLLVAWGAELQRRAGSDEDTKRLQAAFRVQFGEPYPMDRYGPVQHKGKELDQFTRDVCRDMAVKLGNRCDVLFECRRDNAAAQKDDVVEVVCPAQEEFGAAFKGNAEDKAREKGLFRERGTFQVHESYNKHAAGNPFLMIAYAQLNFPNWHEEEGLDRVASLDYHRDPETTRWLEACEDPTGPSYFTHHDRELAGANESFGLGYTSRVFVTNETLRSLRWKPWARAGTAAHNAREAFVLDTLAFALLDVPPGDLGGAIERALDDSGWSTPLLTLSIGPREGYQGDKWEFSRSAFRDHLGQWAPNNPVFRAGQGYTSIGKLLDAMAGDSNAIVEAIAAEASYCLKEILPAHDESFSADGALKQMFRDLATRIETAREGETGPMKDAFVKKYNLLLERVHALSGMSCTQLQQHFERRGRR